MGEEPMINNGNEFNYFWVIILMFKDVFLGLVGGLISYLFDYSKAKRNGNEEFIFRVSGMVINMSLGAFVGYVIGTLLPIETTGRDAIIALSGVTSYNILLLACFKQKKIDKNLILVYLNLNYLVPFPS